MHGATRQRSLILIVGAGALMFASLSILKSTNGPTSTDKALRPMAMRNNGQETSSSRPPRCPPEELSCGLQTPVVSDGVRPFVNEEMGLRVTFPRDTQVCLARSGDAPRGFYAWYGADNLCERPGPRPPAYIHIQASWNALFLPSLVAVAPDCTPLASAVRQRLNSRELTFPGFGSRACQRIADEGAIEITVYTLARQQPDRDLPRELRVPSTIYQATLGTTPARLETDLARFQQVLQSVQID